MLHKLSGRLALSHLLTALVVIPLLGTILLYFLETHYFLDSLANELLGQAYIIAELARDNAAAWSDPAAAHALTDHLTVKTRTQIMLLDKQAHVLSSSLPIDSAQIGKTLTLPVIQNVFESLDEPRAASRIDMNARLVKVAVPVTDPDGHLRGIVYLSHDIEETEQRLAPLRWMVFVTFLVGGAVAVALGLALARSLSAPLTRLSGAVSHLDLRKSPVPLPESGTDELRTLARGFNLLVRRLHDAESARRELLISIVHELGSPLGAIKAAAQTLQNGAAVDYDLTTELASGITSQVDQLRLLVDDLALLREAEVRELRLQRAWIDLSALAEAECQSYRHLIAQKGITLRYRFDSTLPRIYADPIRLRQVLANLLHNAYKFTPAAGEITVTGTFNGQFLVRVSDTGPGIAPEEQARIFDLFYRSPQAYYHQGMGIGLALAHQLARAHGGVLTVESQPGHGATFTLCLPIRSISGNPSMSHDTT